MRLKRLLFVLLMIAWQGLYGVEKVTTTKHLHAGQKALFYPGQGDSFSVQKDLDHLVKGANYDIVMKNGAHIYFENRGEKEDMYIIFNEPLSKGDVIVLKVNDGYFTYTTSQIKALPKAVKKILKASAKRKVKKRVVKKEGNVQIATEEFCFDNRGEIVECSSPLALINQKKQPQTAPLSSKPEASAEKSSEITEDAVQPVKKSSAEPKSNLFSTFAEKIKAALKKIKTTLAKEQVKKSSEEVVKPSIVTSKPSEQSVVSKPKKPENTMVRAQKKEKPTPDAINHYTTPDTGPNQHATQIQRPVFNAIPLKETDLHFAHAPMDAEMLKKPDIALKEPPEAEPQKNTLQAFSTGIKPQLNIAPKTPVSGKPEKVILDTPALQVHTKMPAETISPALTQAPAALSGTKPKPLSVPLPRRGIPVAPSMQKEKAVAPKVVSNPVATTEAKKMIEIANSAIEQQSLIQKPVTATETQTAATPTTIAQTQSYGKPVAQSPLMEQQQMPQKKSVQTEQEPSASPPPPQEQKEPGKIVITKIINKKEATQPAAEAPVAMSDRMLGGGYSEQQNSGKLAVSAYANRKPVSAWVEVYKDKRRVKTFYSGAKKAVRLPEGTYILKATYRMGTSKQKKNLGKVRLKAGDSIRKKVYFSIGTLNIVAKKDGKPLYVKVEIYKKGSRSRYAYTFSSRNNGIAHLQLGQGRYKIVVINHGKKKVLDNVYVKGNQVKTLTVEF